MIRFPPRSILVAFDFTELAQEAFRHAQELAGRFAAAVEVLYVEEPPPVSEAGFLPPKLDAEARGQILRHLRAKVGEAPKVHLLEGDPVVTLLRLARSRRPDLIVLGTHARTGLDRLWSGSVAEAVVKHSPVPVLAVRAGPAPIRSVLAPINFTDYSEYGFIFAAGVAAALGASLSALHVTADPERCGNPEFRLRGLASRLPIEIRKVLEPRVEVRRGRPTEEIVAAAQGHDLVVLVAHRKGLLKDWVLGTTAQRVLRHSSAPVLAVPAPRSPFFLESVAAARSASGGKACLELPAPSKRGRRFRWAV